MILVVKEILETGKSYQPAGKNYTIHQWRVAGTIDGIDSKLLTVKAFKEMILEIGKEYEVKKDEWQGEISYSIQSGDKKGFQKGGFQRPVYSLQEYNDLFIYSVKFVKELLPDTDPLSLAPLISTYLIGARDSGVKIGNPGKTGNENKDLPMTKVDMMNAVLEAIKTNGRKDEWDTEFTGKYKRSLTNISDEQMQELYWKYAK